MAGGADVGGQLAVNAEIFILGIIATQKPVGLVGCLTVPRVLKYGAQSPDSEGMFEEREISPLTIRRRYHTT